MGQKYNDSDRRNSFKERDSRPEPKNKILRIQNVFQSPRLRKIDETRRKTLKLITAELARGRNRSTNETSGSNMQMKWF